MVHLGTALTTLSPREGWGHGLPAGEVGTRAAPHLFKFCALMKNTATEARASLLHPALSRPDSGTTRRYRRRLQDPHTIQIGRRLLAIEGGANPSRFSSCTAEVWIHL